MASATPPCAYGTCNLKVAPQSCKRVEVVGAPRVNLRASNAFHSKDNVIGTTYRGDVFALKRCTKKGCKVILESEQGPVGAWIHSNYLSCTGSTAISSAGFTGSVAPIPMAIIPTVSDMGISIPIIMATATRSQARTVTSS